MLSMSLRLSLAALLSLAAVAACDSDDGGKTAPVADTNSADTSGADTGGADTGATDPGPADTGGAACTRTGFTAEAQDAGDFMGIFRYVAQSTLGAPVDLLTFEFVPGVEGTADGVGTFDFTDASYADCGNCATISYQCDDNLANCAKAFLVQSGTLEITAWDASGGTFAGTLTDAVFVEATFDNAFNSTVVDGGDTWCIDSYAFSATVQ